MSPQAAMIPVEDAGRQNNETPAGQRRKKKIQELARRSFSQSKLRADFKHFYTLLGVCNILPSSNLPPPECLPSRFDPCPCNQRQLWELMSLPWNFHLKNPDAKATDKHEPSLAKELLKGNLIRGVEGLIYHHQSHFYQRKQLVGVHRDVIVKKNAPKAQTSQETRISQAAAPKAPISRQQGGTVTVSTQFQRCGVTIGGIKLPPTGGVKMHKSGKPGNKPTSNDTQQLHPSKKGGVNHNTPFSVSLHRTVSCPDLRSIGLVNPPATSMNVPAVTQQAVPAVCNLERLPFLKEGVFSVKNIAKNQVIKSDNMK